MQNFAAKKIAEAFEISLIKTFEKCKGFSAKQI